MARPRPRAPEARIPALTWKIAAVTGAGAFMAMLDSTVANLAISAIGADFGVSLAAVQWVATGYLIALAVSLPAAGWLGSRYGYGRVWAAALAVFVITSALCAVSPGPLVLTGARFLQGLAAGVLVPAGQAVIGTAAGPQQLGRLMGALGVVVSLGPAVGPAVGGLLLEEATWRWLFWINVPIGIAALAAARRVVTGGARNTSRALDRHGLALLGIGLPLLLYGATETGSVGASAVPLLAVVAGAVLSVGFVRTAVRTDNPLVDLRLFRGRTFAAATATAGLTGANMYGGLLILPLYFLLIIETSTTQTGLLLLAMGLGTAVALPIGGALTDRYGAGTMARAGAGMLVVTTVPFLVPGALPVPALAAVLVVRGVGMALAQLPAITAAYASVTADELGDATTLVNIVQRIGGAIGAGGLVIILAQAGGSTNAAAYAWAFASLAVVSVLTLFSATALRR